MLLDFDTISEPLGGPWGLPGSSTMSQKYFTSFPGTAVLTFDCREGKSAKKSIFARFWTHLLTPKWPGSLPRFIPNGPKWKAKTLKNFPFIYGCCRPYRRVQSRRNCKKVHFCSILDPFGDPLMASYAFPIHSKWPQLKCLTSESILSNQQPCWALTDDCWIDFSLKFIIFIHLWQGEKAMSTVKAKSESSIWAQLAWYIYELGYWFRKRSLLRFWFTKTHGFLQFFQKYLFWAYFSVFWLKNLQKDFFWGVYLFFI